MSLAAAYSIAAIFSAKDKNLKPAISAIEKKFGSLAGVAGRSLSKIDQSMNRVFKVGATAAVAGLTIATGAAIRQFIDLDQAVTQAGAKFVDLDSNSKTYSKSLKEIQMSARNVAKVTEFMATDAAGALDKMAMAGLSSKVSMSLLKGTTNLATAAGTDLTTAVDIATDSLGAFGKSTATAAEAQKNLQRISDLMAKTTTTANTDLNDMFEAVKAGAPAFTAAGQRAVTFSSFVGILANSGIKGAEAGTSLRNVMLRLAKPTGEAAKVLKQLHVQTSDANGNFRDAIDILADLEKGLKGMGTQQKSAALATIFGARTVTGINLLLASGTDKLRKYRSQLDDSTGSAEKMAKAMRGSLKNQIEILKSSAAELGLQFVESFQKDGRGALQGVITAVQNFDMKPVVKTVQDAIKKVKEINAFVQKIGGWGKIAKTILIFATVVKVLTFSMSAYGFIMGIVAKKTLIYAAASKVAMIAQMAFNAVMSANPIALVIIGIAALIAIIVLLVKYWDQVKAAMAIAWEWIKKNKEMFIAMLGPIGNVINLVVGLITRWNEIRDAFKSEGILAGIKKIGQVIFESLIAPLKEAWDVLNKLNPFGEAGKKRRQDRQERRAEQKANKQRERLQLAPNAAAAESEQAKAMNGEGTITVKAEDGTSVQVDKGTMPKAGWDMSLLGKDGIGA